MLNHQHFDLLKILCFQFLFLDFLFVILKSHCWLLFHLLTFLFFHIFLLYILQVILLHLFLIYLLYIYQYIFFLFFTHIQNISMLHGFRAFLNSCNYLDSHTLHLLLFELDKYRICLYILLTEEYRFSYHSHLS